MLTELLVFRALCQMPMQIITLNHLMTLSLTHISHSLLNICPTIRLEVNL